MLRECKLWTEEYDESSGSVYYLNYRTHEQRWEIPECWTFREQFEAEQYEKQGGEVVSADNDYGEYGQGYAEYDQQQYDEYNNMMNTTTSNTMNTTTSNTMNITRTMPNMINKDTITIQAVLNILNNYFFYSNYIYKFILS